MISDLPISDLDAILRQDLMSFIGRCFLELNSTQRLSEAPYLEVMAAKLADTLMGRGPKRLIFCLPPRSLKSISVSVSAVAWLLGHDPAKRIICVSYGQDLANKHARDTRTIMSSSFFRRIFPGCRLSKTKTAVEEFETTRGGYRMATSEGGTLTGRGGDLLILDDMSKPDEILSSVVRKGTNDWFDNTLLSRLDNPKEGVIVIVMHRLHEDDLVGHVLGQSDEWEVVSFPAIAEQEEAYEAKTPFGPFTYKRKVGDVLDPSRETFEMQLNTKRLIGSYNFEAQYQQSPTPFGGNIVRTEWLQYYDPNAPLPKFTTILQSWDTANKELELSDYSVCTTWGVLDSRYFLLDVYRAKVDYPRLRRKVLEQIAKHNPGVVIIEDRGSGIQLLQDLKTECPGRLKPYSPPPRADKVMRMHNQTAHFEGGKVLLPFGAAWVAEYIRELTSFPGAKYDDQVDSTAQALDYMTQNKGIEVWAKLGRG